MASTRTVLKAWFETGDKPTQAQFEELIDSIYNLTDDDISDINGSIQSISGLIVDNTDPSNPTVNISVDGTTITGDGSPGNPLVASGGGGSQTLQDTTDLGNSTTNNILFDESAAEFNNGSVIRKGTTDQGLGGNGGIAQICAALYELKWEAGRLYVMQSDGFTIRQSLYNLDNAPTSADDDISGYVVGSLWSLDDDTYYVCTDATTGAAVWRVIQKAIGKSGYNYVVCESVQGDPIASGANLLAAKTTAEALATLNTATDINRVVVLIMPGLYDLDGNKLLIDTDFIDYVGIGHKTQIVLKDINKTVSVTDNINSLLKNVTIQADDDNCIFCNDNGLTNMKFIDIDFSEMETDVDLNGYWENCKCVAGFGIYTAASSGLGKEISGTFINCESQTNGFGYANVDDTFSLVISGTFKNCKCSQGFGACFEIAGLRLNGTFIDCVALQPSFGYANAQTIALDGIFTNCISESVSGESFGHYEVSGGSVNTSVDVSGTFKNCISGDLSFGSGTVNAVCSGNFDSCVAGGASFGDNDQGGIFSGTMRNCRVGSAASFSAIGGVDVTAKIINCELLNDAGSGATIREIPATTPTCVIVKCITNNGISANITVPSPNYNLIIP